MLTRDCGKATEPCKLHGVNTTFILNNTLHHSSLQFRIFIDKPIIFLHSMHELFNIDCSHSKTGEKNLQMATKIDRVWQFQREINSIIQFEIGQIYQRYVVC